MPVQVGAIAGDMLAEVARECVLGHSFTQLWVFHDARGAQLMHAVCAGMSTARHMNI